MSIAERLAQPPDHVRVIADGRALPGDLVSDGALHCADHDPSAVLMRWVVPVTGRMLGDEWERAYGNLEWRGHAAGRRLPWYVVVHGDDETVGFGVRTGGTALASWFVDPAGITLHLDVRNGGSDLRLGSRRLPLPEVVVASGDDPHDVARDLCARMCQDPLLPAAPVFGSLDWYWAYGDNSPESALREADLVASTAPPGARGFTVIDDGWQRRPDQICTGPWQPGVAFGDMAQLAARIKDAGARPGIWFRPLSTNDALPALPRLPGGGLDPSADETLAQVRTDVSRLTAEWGFELVKHDFSTFDVLGRYGREMDDAVTAPGWHFADRSRTTAEILRELYRTVLSAPGDALVLGCNTVGHLAAGLEHIHRGGDDTSGMEWERTRQMGPNTLAFRSAQHGTFFSLDADCVGLTPAVPWAKNRQWLDLLARSGTVTFVSPHPDAVGSEQRAALQEAFGRAAMQRPPLRALDWMDTTTPQVYADADGETTRYDWWSDDH